MPTAPNALTDPGLTPDRSDRATFVVRSIAQDNWRKNQHIPELRTLLTNVYNNAVEVNTTSLVVQADRILTQADAAAVAAQSPVANAAAAAASALAALGYASTAQATNPDSPIRLNPRKITANFAIASGYNAASVGPIAIAEGVTVTVGDNATWSIH